ncbi:uncharacterized histidine-rich protein DDB_G0274557-like isoform X2 [Hibiscus syriacus]|uniref:uncharacterized histidine-rich protein DDB_G0274557-like isoform X2 n=1 Tax=Hibiscus syriacus TaxID=106335 RepID=UPI00192312BB|nr:uncharacterized histidine-rich protein DDB_G0274557-like isoform X2 [Hibiscus syriacus]
MEPSSHCESWRPPYPVPHHPHPMIHHPRHHHHHYRHHHHYTISCPLHHHHHLITCHSHVSPTLAPLPLQNHTNLESTTTQNEAHHCGNPVLEEQEPEYEELQDIKEEEEEDEPIFVLTDEWREFFAKSEAKRKLEKKKAKKKQKN